MNMASISLNIQDPAHTPLATDNGAAGVVSVISARMEVTERDSIVMACGLCNKAKKSFLSYYMVDVGWGKDGGELVRNSMTLNNYASKVTVNR